MRYTLKAPDLFTPSVLRSSNIRRHTSRRLDHHSNTQPAAFRTVDLGKRSNHAPLDACLHG
jgi:hypothetical protein